MKVLDHNELPSMELTSWNFSYERALTYPGGKEEELRAKEIMDQMAQSMSYASQEEWSEAIEKWCREQPTEVIVLESDASDASMLVARV